MAYTRQSDGEMRIYKTSFNVNSMQISGVALTGNEMNSAYAFGIREVDAASVNKEKNENKVINKKLILRRG